MAEYSKLTITNDGQELMAKMITEPGTVDFTKMCFSDTHYQESQLQELTVLEDIKQTALVSKVSRTNNVAIKIEAAFSNADLTTGYYMRTLGLYAVDPDKGEILYAVCIETTNNCYMPPYNGVTVSAAYIQLYTTVGNAESVSLEVNPGAYATIGDIQELDEKKMNKEEVSDAIVEFTQASSRTNISSGEKLKIIFGKIAKFFADLKTVAFTGNYNDLTNKPQPAVPYSIFGQYLMMIENSVPNNNLYFGVSFDSYHVNTPDQAIISATTGAIARNSGTTVMKPGLYSGDYTDVIFRITKTLAFTDGLSGSASKSNVFLLLDGTKTVRIYEPEHAENKNYLIVGTDGLAYVF